jgi:predicted DNA-binding protein (UPF0251 family)
MSHPVCEVPKNSKETIQLNLEEFKGHRLCDLRVYCEDDKGSLIPTRKGISIPISLWPQIRAGLIKLEAAMIECGWLDAADLEIEE